MCDFGIELFVCGGGVEVGVKFLVEFVDCCVGVVYCILCMMLFVVGGCFGCLFCFGCWVWWIGLGVMGCCSEVGV